MGEVVAGAIRIFVAWFGVSLLVTGLWMFVRTTRLDRRGRIAAVGIALLGCVLVAWSVQAG
jgi:hypothetical protein